MNNSEPSHTEHTDIAAVPVATDAVTTEEVSAHVDPLSGEAGSHPVGVGVGGMIAGAGGAMLGAIAGPIGAVIGAAVGAVAGGLAGRDVAANSDEVGRTQGDGESYTGGDEENRFQPGVPDRIGAYAQNQEQIATPAFDRLSKDVGYQDAHMAEPVLKSPVPPNEVLDERTAAEPGDLNFSHRDGREEISPAAGMPAVPTAGDHPYTISDMPLATDETHAEPVHLGFLRESSTDERIRDLAYQKYLDRVHSGRGGDATTDWSEAEREVLGG